MLLHFYKTSLRYAMVKKNKLLQQNKAFSLEPFFWRVSRSSCTIANYHIKVKKFTRFNSYLLNICMLYVGLADRFPVNILYLGDRNFLLTLK